MGIIQKKLDEVQRDVQSTVQSIQRPKGGGGTADAILEDESEVERLSKYIEEGSKGKIIDRQTALKHGVNRIGTKGDTAGVLGFKKGQLLHGASRKAKNKAAKTLVRVWARSNLTETIKTKSRNVVGKLVDDDTYIKMVRYMRKGKPIEYLQARSISTGKIVKLKQAFSRL